MKNYVRVLALYNEEGDIRPVKMEWEERWLDVYWIFARRRLCVPGAPDCATPAALPVCSLICF